VAVAEWHRRETVDLSTRVQFPPATPRIGSSQFSRRAKRLSFSGVRLTAGRGSLKPATEVRLFHSRPLPVRLVIGLSALAREAVVRFHHRQPFLQHAGVVQLERIPRYERGDMGVRIPPPVPSFDCRLWLPALIFGLSLNWTGLIPPKDTIRVRVPAGRPFLWGTGTARPVHVAAGAID
jgi:hypothetical protein